MAMDTGIVIEGLMQVGATPDDCDTADDLASATFFKVSHVIKGPAGPDDYDFVGDNTHYATMAEARVVADQKVVETGLPLNLWLMFYYGPVDAYPSK